MYSFRNIPVKLNDSTILASEAILTEGIELGPNEIIGKQFAESYAPNSIGGSLRLIYSLTGADPIKQAIFDQHKAFSGNIGGLFFSSGYLKNYNFNLTNQSPLKISAEIAFFDSLSGVYGATPARTDKHETLHTSHASIDIIESVELDRIRSMNFNYTQEVRPSFLIDSEVQLDYNPPQRIGFGSKSLEVELEVDSFTGLLPIRGVRAGFEITFTQPGNPSNSENYVCSGLITQRTFNTAVGQPSRNIIRIRHDFNSNGPTIDSFSPAMVTFNETVTISGSNFLSTNSVLIGSISVPFVVIDDNTIQITITNGALTNQNITVNTAIGSVTSASTLNILYQTIIVNTIYPNVIVPGQIVTINGANFYQVNRVMFLPEAVSSFQVVDSNTILAVVPTGVTSGNVQVISDSLGQTGTSPSSLGVPLSITNWGPTTGRAGDLVYFSGSNVSGITGVRFNTQYSSYSQVSYDVVSAQVPSGNSLGNVTLFQNGGYSQSLSYFQPIAAITGLSPSTGFGGTSLSILGTNFDPGILGTLLAGIKVSINGIITGFKWVNSGTLTGTLPTGNITGPVKIYQSDGIQTFPSSGLLSGAVGVPFVSFFSPSTVSSGYSLTSIFGASNILGINAITASGQTNAIIGYTFPIPAQNIISSNDGTRGTVSGFSTSGFQTGTYRLYFHNDAGSGYLDSGLTIQKATNKALGRLVVTSDPTSSGSGFYCVDGRLTGVAGLTMGQTVVRQGFAAGTYGQYVRIVYPNSTEIRWARIVRPNGFPLNTHTIFFESSTGVCFSGTYNETSEPDRTVYFPAGQFVTGFRIAISGNSSEMRLFEIETY